jgi:hypothetical protein
MKLMSHALAFILLAPCFSCQNLPTPTKEEAIDRGERVFADYLKREVGKQRSDYDDPEVRFATTGVVVTFPRRGTEAQYIDVILSRNGCVSLSGNI